MEAIRPVYPSYPDTWLQVAGSLLIAHFVEVIGRDERFFELLVRQFYYVDVLSGACIAFVIWRFVRGITRWLDQHYDWIEKTLPRICLQVLVGIGVSAVLMFFLVFLQFRYLLHADIFEGDWLEYEFKICVLFMVIINLYYLAYHFFSRWQESSRQLSEARQLMQASPLVLPQSPGPADKQGQETGVVNAKRRVFIVTQGARNLPLSVEQIAYFYKDDAYNFLKTSTGESYLIPESLDDLTESLDTAAFFRANRQTLIHRQACQYYVAIEHGKLEVTLTPPAPLPVIISQKRAKEFKEWMGNR